MRELFSHALPEDKIKTNDKNRELQRQLYSQSQHIIITDKITWKLPLNLTINLNSSWLCVTTVRNIRVAVDRKTYTTGSAEGTYPTSTTANTEAEMKSLHIPDVILIVIATMSIRWTWRSSVLNRRCPKPACHGHPAPHDTWNSPHVSENFSRRGSFFRNTTKILNQSK